MPSVPGADPDRLGEVVEASVSHLVAQCHRLGEPPALGSLVRTSDGGLDRYGVVYDSSTRSIDPGRRFMALGQEEVSQEDVYRSHPELSQLLRTDFEALVVGYRDRGAFRHFLPPRPAAIHAFVFLASDEELRSFTSPWVFFIPFWGPRCLPETKPLPLSFALPLRSTLIRMISSSGLVRKLRLCSPGTPFALMLCCGASRDEVGPKSTT